MDENNTSVTNYKKNHTIVEMLGIQSAGSMA
jgi:hypothetical protein